MKTLAQKLFFLLGMLTSVNQGVTLVLGQLTDGTPRGADVFMPLDIPLYILFFIKKKSSVNTRYAVFVNVISILVFFFYLLSFTSEFIAVEKVEGRFMIVHLTRSLLLFYLMATRLSDQAEILSLVKGLLLGLLFQSAIGFYQWQVGPVVLPFFNIVNTWRSSGTLGPPNAFGAYLLTLVPFAVRAVFYLPLKPKWLWGSVLLLSIASLFSSYVRGAWLAFIISTLIFFLVDMSKSKLSTRRKFTFIVIVVMFGIGLSLKYGDEIVNRMADSEESMMGDAKHSRKSLALDAMRIIDEHPLLGVGINNYRYYADKQTGGTRIVHNAYLLITAEQGMISGILFVVVHLLIFFMGIRLLRSPSAFYYQIGAAALTSMLGICIYHLVAPDYRLTGVIIQHWRIVGMVLGLVIADELNRRRLHAARPKWTAPGLGRFPKQNSGAVMTRSKAF